MIREYAIISFGDNFIIFGGVIGNYIVTRTVAAFSITTRLWEKIGLLNVGIRQHGVIMKQYDFLVLGGRTGKDNFVEKCSLKGGKIKCAKIAPNLYDNYYQKPIIMKVPENYCPK